MAKKKSEIKPGGVDEYIAKCPKDIQDKLKSIRMAIRQVAPDAVETVSYFQMPGYFYGGNYAYNGMFVWFSYKNPFVRLHVWPPVIQDHKEELANYATTTAIVSFPTDKEIPVTLVVKLVKASLKAMKDKSK
ncbi:MAG TPA: DUF1801 domain-containing protein [Candidatus Saccharimonadales bacterium]|nr:DUF1801 domain-containing protein [Candidatus Saccharimonadales bacterium]